MAYPLIMDFDHVSSNGISFLCQHISDGNTWCDHHDLDKHGCAQHMLKEHLLHKPQVSGAPILNFCPWSLCPLSRVNTTKGADIVDAALHFLDAHVHLSFDQSMDMIHRVQALDQITPAVSSEMPQLHFDTQFEYPDPSTVGQHAVQPQVNRGRQPPYESWENAGQPSFDDGFGYEPPVHAVDPKLTLRSTAGADIDDALFRQTLLQFNGEHRAPALPITTNAQPPAPRRQSPNWGLGSFRPQGARGSRAAPTPARQRAAKGPIRPLKGNRATKPPTVPCSEPGCEKFFSTAQVMRDHIEAEHRGVRVPCTHPGCSLDFDNRANMGRHKMSVHNQVTHECPYAGCDYTATRRDNLKSRHMPVCPHRPENDNDNE